MVALFAFINVGIFTVNFSNLPQLSFLVHPDKNPDELDKAQQAFEGKTHLKVRKWCEELFLISFEVNKMISGVLPNFRNNHLNKKAIKKLFKLSKNMVLNFYLISGNHQN